MIHLAPLITDLAVILGIAGMMSLICHQLKQPVVLGYLFAGLLIGPASPLIPVIQDAPNIQTWAELGVIFLMFGLGLEFSFRKLSQVGLTATVTADLEILYFFPMCYLLGKWLSLSTIESLFLASMLSISSTTIVMKSLEDFNLKSRRFASLILGVLVVEDLNAILLIVGLTTLVASHSISAIALIISTLKLILFIGGWFIFGYFLIPRFIKHVGKTENSEMITLVSLSLCLSLVVFANHYQYSTALGAFIMGSILAETPLSNRIEEHLIPLKNVFGSIFFVSMGMLINPLSIWNNLPLVIGIASFTIISKIFIVTLGQLLSGQSFKNALQVGLGLSQIGEFSFIIAGLGTTLGVLSADLASTIVAVSLITTFTSPYLIKNSSLIAAKAESLLSPKIRNNLQKFHMWSEQKRAGRESSGVGKALTRWLINGVIVALIFLASSRWLTHHWNLIFSWLAAAVLSLPFIWAMLFLKGEQTPVSLHFLTRAFTPIWIGFLSTNFFPGRIVIFAGFAVLVLFLAFFYKHLESYYDWYEKNFLSTFENKDRKTSSHERLNHLAPWEMHLVKIVVHANSPVVQKTLLNTELRTKHGVNIVAIQRGVKTIVAPHPTEQFLPGDELIVLGTDHQVDAIKKFIEKPHHANDIALHSLDYELRKIELKEQSIFINKTIRHSGFRETYHAMVVGIERDGQRNPNPDSDLILLERDVLWIVGNKSELDKIPL